MLWCHTPHCTYCSIYHVTKQCRDVKSSIVHFVRFLTKQLVKLRLWHHSIVRRLNGQCFILILVILGTDKDQNLMRLRCPIVAFNVTVIGFNGVYTQREEGNCKLELCAGWQIPTRPAPKTLSPPRPAPSPHIFSPPRPALVNRQPAPAPHPHLTRLSPQLARSWLAVSPHMNKFH